MPKELTPENLDKLIVTGKRAERLKDFQAAQGEIGEASISVMLTFTAKAKPHFAEWFQTVGLDLLVNGYRQHVTKMANDLRKELEEEETAAPVA